MFEAEGHTAADRRQKGRVAEVALIKRQRLLGEEEGFKMWICNNKSGAVVVFVQLHLEKSEKLPFDEDVEGAGDVIVVDVLRV